jgi:hypothetical protein
MYRGDLARIEWLDHFGITNSLDLPWRHGMNVETAKVGPRQSAKGEDANGRHKEDREGRGRRLEYLKRCRQELTVASSDR